MQSLQSKSSRTSYVPRIVTVSALALWGLLVLVFAFYGAESPIRPVTTGAAYWGSAVLATLAVGRALSVTAGREKLLWGLFLGGLALRFAGDLGWLLLQRFVSEYALLPQAAYLLSYLLLLGSLLCLVNLTTSRIAPITALDALTIVLSVGSLVYFFVLGTPGSGVENWQEAVGPLIRPSFDSALLFLCLVVLSTNRPPAFSGFLASGFLVFLLADAAYLPGIRDGAYDPGSWPGMIFAGGTLLLGLGALRAAPGSYLPQGSIEPWRVLSFWLGPLSPPVHYAFILIWGVFNPPLPSYVYAIGAFILLCMALRVALVSLVTAKNTREQEDSVRKLEHDRLLRDLHDTIKQEVHGISLALGSAREAERSGNRDATQKTLDRAFRVSREAEYRISRPYEELRAAQNPTPQSPDDYLRERLAKFEEYFGIKTHEDLREPLDVLNKAEVAAVNRVVIEAFWNVAKHSKAGNLYLESRRVGNVLIVRIRDDGRGFDPRKPSSGMGLQYIRQRAGEVGATLDVISNPGRGATVQLRFEKKWLSG